MQIVLIRKNEISKTVLPQKVSGQQHVYCDVIAGEEYEKTAEFKLRILP